MKKSLLIRFLLITWLSLSLAGSVQAQCSMCRRIAETNMEKGENTRGRGLNNGILYMMSVPYLLGATGVFIWWRYKTKKVD